MRYLVSFFIVLLASAYFPLEPAGHAGPPVKLFWGIPGDVSLTYFSGHQREVQGEEVRIKESLAEVTMIRGSSYIIPIFARSPMHLEEIRYAGNDIPKSFRLQWLEPYTGTWYEFAEIPKDFVKVIIEEHETTWSIDFGPPQGAVFADEIPRFIWFKITPGDTGTFRMTIHGYRSHHRVTNILQGVFTVIE